MNVIQLESGGDWHIWTKTLWPICGEGKAWKDHPEFPKFVKSMRHEHEGYRKIKNFCKECLAKNANCKVEELNENDSVKLLKACAAVASAIKHLSKRDKATVLKSLIDVHQLSIDS